MTQIHTETHTIKSGDLTLFLRHWLFRINCKSILNDQCDLVRTGLLVRRLGSIASLLRLVPGAKLAPPTRNHTHLII